MFVSFKTETILYKVVIIRPIVLSASETLATTNTEERNVTIFWEESAKKDIWPKENIAQPACGNDTPI